MLAMKGAIDPINSVIFFIFLNISIFFALLRLGDIRHFAKKLEK